MRLIPAAPRQISRAVRELRQRKAYYRCCIPALAGFVSLRSIAPDGIVHFTQNPGAGKQKHKKTQYLRLHPVGELCTNRGTGAPSGTFLTTHTSPADQIDPEIGRSLPGRSCESLRLKTPRILAGKAWRPNHPYPSAPTLVRLRPW
jgi:hypothetical protein